MDVMDLKWIVLVLIVAFAGVIYARAMRRAHAGWGEIIFPWRRQPAPAIQDKQSSGPAPAR
jgi:hypothetical protein